MKRNPPRGVVIHNLPKIRQRIRSRYGFYAEDLLREVADSRRALRFLVDIADRAVDDNRKLREYVKALQEQVKVLAVQSKPRCQCGHIYADHDKFGGSCLVCHECQGWSVQDA